MHGCPLVRARGRVDVIARSSQECRQRVRRLLLEQFPAPKLASPIDPSDPTHVSVHAANGTTEEGSHCVRMIASFKPGAGHTVDLQMLLQFTCCLRCAPISFKPNSWIISRGCSHIQNLRSPIHLAQSHVYLYSRARTSFKLVTCTVKSRGNFLLLLASYADHCVLWCSSVKE